MKLGINVMFGVLVVLTGSSQTGGQSSVSPPGSTPTALPSHTGTSVSPDPTEDPGNEAPQWTHNLASGNETWTESTTGTPRSQETVPSDTQTNTVFTTLSPATPTNIPFVTNSPSAAPSSTAAADGLSSTASGPLTTSPQHTSTLDSTAPLTSVSLATFSSQPTHAGTGVSSTAPTSTSQSESESFSTASWRTTGRPQTSAPGRAPAGPTHHQGPSELNVGDEELKNYHSRSRLDPLLAGLLSVFIVSTAVVFVVLFLKFRQRTNHPEFHRLQDVPMDDLMEDTPLSRYSY